MKRALALAAIATLATLALVAAERSAQAVERWPAIPPELAVVTPYPPSPTPYRCTTGPVYNAYHGALYSEPPAIYRGFAYRPYYRYTAARVVPRTYFCVE
ncbi:hypothetical protein CI1B_53280 [Bradyrhizobium ivorense]|uniref:Uncharacterized protein n=1 Tax=Bradyrhizobium ivorense TaxID=2511166 RepID=A0A508TJT2_9BRAD|nr:hypothetical protein [Bradyrhizobium ivorense]VIO74555.1 hypothetical protein CI1B_53280 [Bradyrhizobium ivorense]